MQPYRQTPRDSLALTRTLLPLGCPLELRLARVDACLARVELGVGVRRGVGTHGLRCACSANSSARVARVRQGGLDLGLLPQQVRLRHVGRKGAPGVVRVVEEEAGLGLTK